MRTLPATRVPCFHPTPRTNTADISELTTKRDHESLLAGTEVNIQAFAAVVRALLGTTAEFAFLLDDDKVVVVEGVDEHGALEKYEIVDKKDVGSGLEGIQVQLSLSSSAELVSGINLLIIDTVDEVKLRYNPRLLPSDLAQRLLDLYARTLDHNSAPSILNHPPKSYPVDAAVPTLLHALFLLSAKSRPKHTAVDYLAAPGISPQRHILTYAELDQRSFALAKTLLSLSGSGNQVVPFLIPASAEIYVAYLGILRAGKAFAPLPTLDGAPVARVLEQIEDVGAKVVVGLGERPEWLVKGVEWVDVADAIGIEERAAKVEVEMRELAQDADELAYVLFTSGSTGKPKGVQIAHRAAATSIHGHLSVRRVSPSARWFQFAAATFDPSVMEIFCTLACGATLLSADRPRFLSDPDKTLAELGATNMMATPSMAAVLKADRIVSLRDELYGPVDGVEHNFELWTMGEKLSERVIAEFTQPGFALYNAYGPTEAAINVTLRAHPSGESGARLGPPLPTASMLVLHPTENRAIPLGLAGELALAGDQLAKGYLNNLEQTARAFVDVPGVGRVYRTGDWARAVVGADGEWSEVEYLGRMGGDQVKLSGRRVELGEIDSVLSAVHGVQALLSVVSEGRLVALVVPEDRGAVQDQLVEQLKKVADEKLPLHMRPAAYYFAESVPRSSSGKADRRAVARIVAEREAELQATSATAEQVDADAEEDEDASPALQLVKRLVAEIADVPLSAVHARSSLLRLGVDSLKAVRLLSLLRDAGAKELAGLGIADILGCQTVGDVVAATASKSQEDQETRSTAVEKTVARFRTSLGADENAEIYPATPMQAGVLALYLRTEGGRGYINHSVFHLRAHIDVDELKEAWAGVVKRNGILRAKFVLVDDAEASKIAPFAVVVEDDWEGRMQAWEERDGGEGVLEAYLGEAGGRIGLERPWCGKVLRGKEGEGSVFVLTLHHAIFDGASLALMLEELYANYAGLSAPPRSSFEHSVRDALGADMDAAEKYWQGVLEGFSQDPFPDLTGLRAHAKNGPSMFTADSSPSHHVATVVSHTAYSQLQERARTLETSPLAVVQAAWAALLLGLSEAETPDIVFGSLVGGRSSPELETAVGPVFTAVPVRVKSNAIGSTKEVLAKLRAANAPSVRHRYPPVGVLSGEKGIIYDTTIALQSFGKGESQTGLWKEAEYPPMVTEFAAVLEIWPEANDSIRLRLTGSNTVLTPAASTGLLEQFDDIVSAILSAAPDAPFPTLAAGVRPTLLSALNTNPTPAETPTDALIHHEFERNAAEHPNALAVWFKSDLGHPELDVKWTYAELDARANKLANFLLREYGDLTDIAVPLCMEKCAELYVAIFGVLKAGGAWCPVDAAAPAMRKRDLFGRAGGPVVLVRDQEGLKSHKDALPEGLDILALDDERLEGQEAVKPSVKTTPEDLAYLIWTSGTTGAPKGVPIQHKAAVQSLAVLQDIIPAGSDPVLCLNFSAYTFDVSVLDVFYALGKCCGTLCSAYKDVLVSQFDGAVDAFKASHAFLTPAFMAQSSLAECPSLRALISIGEKLPDVVADKWCRPGVVSLNTYGPAESTIIATYRRWELDEATKAHNVGVPIPTVSSYAVKGDLVLPRGAVGELALGGYQNARGYHRQPDMTAKKFIEHPAAGQVYLTGDIVRFLHDGTIEFVGRTDDLVKLGGIRVELSEISTALESSHPRSAEVFTMQLGRHDRPQKTLVSFIAAPSLISENMVCTDFEAVDIASSTMQRAAVALPAFMHPSVYIVVKRLPHTASNKVDRKTLAEYYSSLDLAAWEESLAKVTGQVEDGAWSDTAETVRKIVSELTGTPIERVKKTTPLPALGVDSIRALQLASRLRKAGFSVSVGDILAHSTIQQLVEVDAKKTGRAATTSVWCDDFDRRWRPAVARGLPDQVVRRVIPCTPLQEGMLGETNKNPDAYWSHRLFQFNAGCQVEKLVDAWTAIAARTEALRMVFPPAATFAEQVEQAHTEGYTPVFLQALLAHPVLRIRREAHLDASDAREYARNIVASYSRTIAPLWAVTILGADSSSPTMLVSMHHALYDGPAYDFLLNDVATLYNSGQPRQRLQLTSSVSLAFFSVDPGKSQSYWEEILKPFADPYARQFPDLSDHALETGFTTREFSLSRETLASAATAMNASIGNVLQVAWAVILGAYMHSDKVVFGETRSLRFVDASLEEAISPMIATIPIAVSLDPARSVRAIVETLAQNSAVHTSHYFVTLQHIRRVLQRPVGPPLFPAIFVMNADEPAPHGPSLWEEAGSLVNLTVEHPLAVNVYVSKDKAVVRVSGSSSTLSGANVALLAQQYSAVVNRMLENVDRPVHELRLLDERLLSIVRGRSAEPASTLELSTWLSQSVERTPEAIAVTSYEATSVLQCSYEELDQRSNQIARWIMEHCPHSRVVAISLPRSLSAIAYTLGILKSGRTYLAIEDSLPRSRKALAARAANADLIFTSTVHAKDFYPLSPRLIAVIDTEPHYDAVKQCSKLRFDFTVAEPAYITFAGDDESSAQGSTVSSISLTAAASAYAEHFGEGSYLAWAPLGSELHLVELVAALGKGVTIANVATERFHLHGLKSALNATCASQSAIPVHLLEKERLRPSDVPSFSRILLPGIPVASSLLQEWSTTASMTVTSAFGVPELSGLCALGAYDAEITTVGRPRQGLTAVVLRQESTQIALKGESGDLYFTGEPVGYLRPTLEDSRIDLASVGSLVRTGIVAHIRPDNSIVFDGRSDVCRIVGRPTVRLSEVSSALVSLSRLPLHIVSLSLDHPQGMQTYVVSFVARRISTTHDGEVSCVCEQDASITRSLLASARARLQAHLVPDIIMPLTFLPYASWLSDAPDTKHLRRLFYNCPVTAASAQGSESKDVARALTETEERIRDVLSAATRVPSNSIQANTTTLELGVDSLSAISLSLNLKAAGFFVPPHVIVTGPTVEKLAKASRATIKDHDDAVDWEVEPLVKQQAIARSRHTVESILPCLPLQEGLVALTLNNPDPIYVNHFVTILEKDTDVDRLKNAILETIRANGILRTCFFTTSDSILQVVLAPGDETSQWHLVDGEGDGIAAAHLSMPDIERNIIANISHVPPARFTLIQDSAGMRLLCWTLHHAVYDGETLPMIMAEVCERYKGAFALQRPPVDKLLAFLARQSLESARSFFTEYLDEAPRPPLLSVPASDSRHHRQRLSLSLSEVERSARASNTSLHSLALSAFGVALAEYYGRSDVVFGLVLSGRTVLVDRIADMLAPCITTVPVRVRYSEQPLFGDVVAQVQGDMEPIMEFQHTPLRHIQRWVGANGPLFSSLFNFVRQDSSSAPSSLWTQLESKAVLDYPLAIAVEADTHTDSIYVRAGHLPSFGSAATVKALVTRMVELLEDPTQVLPELDGAPDLELQSMPKPVYNDAMWSDAETLIRDAVAEICGVSSDVVSKDVSFLQLGVDSITSIRLAQLLRTRGLPVPTHAIMRNPCVGALAQFLRETPAESTTVLAQREFSAIEGSLMEAYAADIPLLAQDDKIVSIFPATPLQTGMLTETVSSGGRLYLVPHALRLDESVSLSGLRGAIVKVIGGIDIFRSTFHAAADGDYPWLVAVHAMAPLRWEEHQFDSGATLHAEALKIVSLERLPDEKAFERPPISVHVLEAPNVRVLIMFMHHCLYDGLSLPYFLADVASSYRGQESPSRPQFLSAAPHILYSSQDRAGFWAKHLAGFFPAPLPRVSTDSNATHRARESFMFPDGALQTIMNMGVTVQAVALLAWGKVLATVTNSPDIVFGHVVSGRAIELEDALHASGPLFNTIPFRFTLRDPTWSNAEAAQAQQQANIAAEPYQHVPLRKIQRDWRMSNELGGAALFDSLFVFQQVMDKTNDRSDLWSSYDLSDEPTSAQYPLSLEVVHSGSTIELRAGCRSTVFAHDALVAVLAALKESILNIVMEPEACVVAYPPSLETVAKTPRIRSRPSDSQEAQMQRDFTDNERILRDVVATVSKIPLERIGLTTPLWALGLDSVAAIQITARCRGEDLPITVADVFAGETVMGICAVYDERIRTVVNVAEKAEDQPLVTPEVKSAALTSLALREGEVEDVLPLLAGQDYHIASWLASGGTFYQPVFIYKASGHLDAAKMEQAWRALQQRHSILRTAFVATSSSTAVQVVLKTAGAADWHFIETEGDFDAIVRQHVQNEYMTPSTLSVPPARVRLLRVGDKDALLLSLHHATYDAWTVPLLVGDLSALYRGENCRSNPGFSGLVKHLSTVGQTDEDASKRMWCNEIHDGPSLLPVKRPDVGLKQVFVRASGVISSVSMLQEKCQASGISLQGIVLAVWGSVMRELTGAEQPIVGVYHTGRSAAFDAIDVLAGPTVNVLPMRLPAVEGVPVRDVARQLQVEMGRRTKYEQTRLRDIVSWTLGEEHKGPLFNAWLNLLWHGDKIRTIRKGSESLLESFSVGPPTDLVPSTPFDGLRTSVDALDTSFLPEHGFFADVVLNTETDSIGLAMRAHEALLDSAELENVVKLFEAGVYRAIDEL